MQCISEIICHVANVCVHVQCGNIISQIIFSWYESNRKCSEISCPRISHPMVLVVCLKKVCKSCSCRGIWDHTP